MFTSPLTDCGSQITTDRGAASRGTAEAVGTATSTTTITETTMVIFSEDSDVMCACDGCLGTGFSGTVRDVACLFLFSLALAHWHLCA